MEQALPDLMNEHAGTPYWKVLLCAQDIADALAGTYTPAPPKTPGEADLTVMMGIDVTVTPDSAPGTWRLIRHDHCAVTDEGRVTHGECTILGEGRQRPSTQAATEGVAET